MKKLLINQENPNGITIDMTADEISNLETQQAETNSAIVSEQAKEDLKVSAKTKLMAGEPLTEEEADVMLGG